MVIADIPASCPYEFKIPFEFPLIGSHYRSLFLVEPGYNPYVLFIHSSLFKFFGQLFVENIIKILYVVYNANLFFCFSRYLSFIGLRLNMPSRVPFPFLNPFWFSHSWRSMAALSRNSMICTWEGGSDSGHLIEVFQSFWV